MSGTGAGQMDLDDRLDAIRVGVDMDGVLADFNQSWIGRYNREFDTGLDVSEVVRWEGLHRLTHFETMPDFWAWARAGSVTVFRDAPAFPGALDAVRRIAGRYRLVIVSSKFDWAIPDSLAWLAEHEIPAQEVHFLWDKTAARCDVYLEDAPHQLRSLRDGLPEATVCRMVRPWNEPLPGVQDVHDWAEFEDILERVAQGTPSGPEV